MGGQITRNTFYDSLNGPFPAPTHRCHHKPKRCLPIQPCGNLSSFPLLFHPSTKGSQIIMDISQRTVKRQASFCNAITFSNRPIAVFEQVRLKITKSSAAGVVLCVLVSHPKTHQGSFQTPCPSMPALTWCPRAASGPKPCQKSSPMRETSSPSGWIKGPVFYRIIDSSPMLFFSGVHVAEPLWALIDVYGLTRGVQLLDSEMVPLDCLRPRSFATAHRASIQRNSDDPRLSISLCDLSLQQQEMHLEEDEDEEERLQPLSSTSCHVPQNSQNSQQCSLLPSHLDNDLHFHSVHGIHVTALDKHTVARLDHRGDERTLVFTSRPMRCSETVFVKVKAGATRPGCLSYGVTSCDPAILRPSDLPSNPESLVDRKEFWAVCRVAVPLHSGDILGFVVNAEGEVMMSHNGVSAGMQLCVDNSRPLWMFYGLHGTITQLRILGSSLHPDLRGPSVPSSPSCTPNTPTVLCSGNSESNLNTSLNINLNSSLNSNYHTLFSSSTGTTPSSPFSSYPVSPTFPSCSGSWSDECTICYENVVDTVLYACGHMCLCYACGLKLKKMANACCPICRRTIKDIIKTYRST
ncbi:E3 ubiquitin-protein ligase NEURL1-like [Parambassis ranga]|uniref:E3 ubiquitin-protein ligase NEURL1-like n=1 Tax=Parambassis ranga TaxID=210632 RepID=A0A6P7JR84_9TELE|nr:E3 ubiquitin-protein ligase NEURL1-like [Parambassis ranga]XP_028279343.1 E3 ubiquitin-protein ligase NEURL1-like [Parambassis ranga]